MTTVRGIVVHQTNASTAASTLYSYENGTEGKPDGAHFLIDKDGTIYQTARLNQQTGHVGKLRARCLVEMRCSATELPDLEKWKTNSGGNNARRTHNHEKIKPYPIRYPSNVDSIGIECVGKAYEQGEPDPKTGKKKEVFEPLTKEQKQSLRWLIYEIGWTLKVPMTEVFRHPILSIKNETEAISAKKLIEELQAEETARKAKKMADRTEGAQ